jgi:hypothetical protein
MLRNDPIILTWSSPALTIQTNSLCLGSASLASLLVVHPSLTLCKVATPEFQYHQLPRPAAQLTVDAAPGKRQILDGSAVVALSLKWFQPLSAGISSN